MIAEGIYRVYALRHKTEGQEREYLGRFSLQNRSVHVLEDHRDMLHSVITDGIVDQRTEDRLDRLLYSPNIVLEHEGDLHAGLHDIPEVPDAGVVPTEVLDVTEPNGNRHVVEVYGDHDLRMDGKSLSPQEREVLTARLKTGMWEATHRA